MSCATFSNDNFLFDYVLDHVSLTDPRCEISLLFPLLKILVAILTCEGKEGGFCSMRQLVCICIHVWSPRMTSFRVEDDSCC